MYDDLYKQALAYRQLSLLLLRRPPGREAYPGRRLQPPQPPPRARREALGRRSEDQPDASKAGGGSLTALPIIETQAGDVSAYIPTNVISITDGQIYLEPDLFNSGVRPAVNVGISVSRVGGSAQVKAMKTVAGRLRLDLAQFRAMETFAQFASDLDAATQQQLARGQRTVEVLKQPQYQPVPVERQIVAIYAVTNGYLDDLEVADVRKWERGFLDFIGSRYEDVLIGLRQQGSLTEDIEGRLKECIEEYNQVFAAEAAPAVAGAA